MTKFNIQKEMKRNIILLILVNFLVHGLMIFVSGYWWDDYKYVIVNNMTAWKEHYLQAGRPIAYYMISSIHGLPVWMFRSLVFAFYMLVSVLIYLVLCRINLPSRTSLIIAVLFVAIPINDARLLICVYPYTLALLLFWSATYLLVNMLVTENRSKRACFRIFALVLFFFSFANSALMFFYVIPMGYVCFFEIRDWTRNKLSIKKLIWRMGTYIDFVSVPIIFFILKKIFFTPFGLYEGYNSITKDKLIYAVKHIISITYEQLKIVLANGYLVTLGEVMIIIVISLGISLVLGSINQKTKQHYFAKRNCLLGVFCGVIIFIAGLFPYAVIRTVAVNTVAIGGRDSMLLGLGMAIAIYFIFELLGLPQIIVDFLVCAFVLIGIFHFAEWYITYQKDYYEEVALEQHWKNTEGIIEGTNFIHIDKDDRRTIEGVRYYSLNHMACETFGKTSRFFANGIDDLYLFTEGNKRMEYELYKETEGLSDYDFANLVIDGIEEYKYDITSKQAVALKFKEMFDKQLFYEQVKQYGTYQYISITEEQSNKIMQAYNEGLLDNNDSLLLYTN